MVWKKLKNKPMAETEHEKSLRVSRNREIRDYGKRSYLTGYEKALEDAGSTKNQIADLVADKRRELYPDKD